MSAGKTKSKVLRTTWALLGSALLLVCIAEALNQSIAQNPSIRPTSAPQDVSAPRLASPTGSGNAYAAGDESESPMMARGRALFAKQCAICHGDQGDGQGKFAYLMNPRPRNFKQGKFKLTTTQNLIASDDDLLRTISRGMPGSAMPPWGHLPPADLRALVAFIRTTHVDAVRKQIEDGVKDGTFEASEAPALLATRTQPGPTRARRVAGLSPGPAQGASAARSGGDADA